MPYLFEDFDTAMYNARCTARDATLKEATMKFINYFVNSGDSPELAQSKVSQVSAETAPYLYAYVLGNVHSLVNAINDSSLEFMDEAAKNELISYLTV
jgi:GH25 family lysozyme M1 (1,4-beta-N-acetylmuramidase)